jgi:hypothetical protein
MITGARNAVRALTLPSPFGRGTFTHKLLVLFAYLAGVKREAHEGAISLRLHDISMAKIGSPALAPGCEFRSVD